MVLMFMIFQIEKSKIVFTNIYDEHYNDTNKKIREVYLRERIMEEYLYLKSIENDQKKIINNQISPLLVVEHFNENYHIDTNSKENEMKYEGVIIVSKPELFPEEKVVYWKHHLGYCLLMLCDESENMQMASNFMTILEMFITKENINKVDYLIPLFDMLLPSGQLMFVTVEYAKNLIKNINI